MRIPGRCQSYGDGGAIGDRRVNGQKQAALWVMGTVGVLVAWGGVGAEPSGPTRRVLPADGRIVITE
jgi:hypothetical protein